MLSPCELLTQEAAFNRPCSLCPRTASEVFSAPWGWPFLYPSRSPVLSLGFSALEKTFLFFPPNNHLFVALKQNFLHKKQYMKRQWQPLICMRIAKPSAWLTVNSSLPRLLAELIRLRVYKFFANLYVHRSEVQITDGTAPRYHQVDFNSEHLPEVVSLPPHLGCANLILHCTPLVLLWAQGTPFEN